MPPTNATAPGAPERPDARRGARSLVPGRRGRRATAAPVDPARQERLAFQLLAIAYRQHPASLAVNLLVALVVAWQVGDAEPATWRWLAVVCALTAVRGALYVAFKRRGARAAVDVRSRRRWQHAHEAGLLAAAALWAVLAWRALPGLPDEPRFVIVVSIGGLTAGASGMLAPLRGPAILYMSVLTLPGAVRLLQGDAAFLGLLVSAFLLVMLVGHAMNRAVLLRSLALQEDNAGLVASLRTQNDRVRQLNASLERRVAERTEALETMAHHDALTGLANRRGCCACSTSGSAATRPTAPRCSSSTSTASSRSTTGSATTPATSCSSAWRSASRRRCPATARSGAGAATSSS